MLVLANTTDNLQVVLGAAVTANQLRCFSTWRDITTTAYTPGRTVTNTNDTTDVNLVAAPGASTQRVIDSVSIYNADTMPAAVIVKYDDNGTEYTLCRALLNAGDRLEYTSQRGFQHFNSLGQHHRAETVQNPSTVNAFYTRILGADVVNNNATANVPILIPDMEFYCERNARYFVDLLVVYAANATTTGSRWLLQGPLAPSLSYLLSKYSLTVTSETTNYVSNYTTPSSASGSSANTAGNVCCILGTIVTLEPGRISLAYCSEVAGAAITAKAGSRLCIQRLS